VSDPNADDSRVIPVVDELASSDQRLTSNVPVQPVRSASFKRGQNAKEMAGDEYYYTSRQSSGETSSPTSAQGFNGSKMPLKRTRSLMQRLRAMVRLRL
jgi:hypothetical protein